MGQARRFVGADGSGTGRGLGRRAVLSSRCGVRNLFYPQLSFSTSARPAYLLQALRALSLASGHSAADNY